MRRRFSIVLPLVAWVVAAAGAACAQEHSLQPVPLDAFHAVEVAGMAHVVLAQGDRETMAVDAPRGTRARIQVENDKGVLTLSVREEPSGLRIFGHGDGQAPKITLTFRTLDAIRVGGMAKVEAARIAVPSLEIEATGTTRLTIGTLETATLHVQGSGALKAEIAGRATEQHVEISGAGDYRAGDLVSDAASVQVSGAGRVLVRVAKTLDVQVSGAGIVDYIGNPAVTQEISGAGRVRRRERVTQADAAAPGG